MTDSTLTKRAVRWGAIITFGVGLACLIGGVAAWIRDGELLTFLVFAACLLPPSIALGWVLQFQPLIGDHDVETDWERRAAAGAFWDVVIVAAAGFAVLGILDTDLSAELVLALIFGLGMLDQAIRRTVLQRREG